MLNDYLDLNSPIHGRCLIGGEWRDATSGSTIIVENPATGASIGSVPNFEGPDTADAVRAAAMALPDWKARTAEDRAEILQRWHTLVLSHEEALAHIMTAEQGKPISEARGEIRYAATFIKWFAEEARRVEGRGIPAPERNRRILVMKEAIGVAAAITPWNFPAAMITRKCAPALAAGCTVVIKPSELTPFTALALGKLAEHAGFPAGVVNIVTGMPKAIGEELTSNPIVRKLSFTGSTAIGRLLMRQCSDTIKRLSLELGGNAPLIVFDDADIDVAVASTMVSKFRNAGQTCVCANRIFVQDKVFDTFAERLSRAVSALKVGNGNAPGTTIGPLINRSAVDKVKSHLEDALSRGATLSAAAEGNPDPSRFSTPMLLTGASMEMKLASEETFGPLAPLFRFKHEEDAIELANATPYGLASYFYTENINRAFRVAERLETGMVGLNTGSISMEVSPFGGVKQSGLGREGSREGMDEFLETKTFHVGGLKL